MSTTDADVGRPAPGTPGPPWQAASTFMRALVDDAAIFPPGNAALADAVRAHHGHRASWYGPAVGPLLVRLSDVTALNALLDDGAGLSIGLICPPAASPSDVERAITDVQRGGRAAVRALEQPVGGPGDLSGLLAVARPHEARAWAEVPQGCTLDGSLHQRLDDVGAAGPGAGAKYRTGGVTPEAFPTEQQLARFVLGCVARRLPFKLTAGLHHAVRHTAAGQPDQPPLEQHGLLNVMTAVAAARDGAGEPDLVALLADRDARRVAGAVAALDDATVGRVREAFSSFGCCGVTDPLTDLVTLGLLRAGSLDRPADKETS
jgi:hypothetical protein